MKKQKIIGTALVFAIAATVMVPFGGGLTAFADVNSRSGNQGVMQSNVEVDYDFGELDEDYRGLVNKGVITQAEADALKAADEKADALYDSMPEAWENMTDEQWESMMKKEAAFYGSLESVLKKIDAYNLKEEISWDKEYYYTLVNDGVITQIEADKIIDVESKVLSSYEEGLDLSDEEFDILDEKIDGFYDDISDIQDKIDATLYYKGLADENVLTASEIEQLKAIEQKADAIYADTEDESVAEEKVSKLYESISSILDKLSAYEEKNALADETTYYQELIKEGLMTAEEVEALKAADDKVNNLIQNTDAKTDAEWEALEKQIEAIYKTVK